MLREAVEQKSGRSADRPGAVGAKAKGAEKERPRKRRKRGRPIDTDLKLDKRIFDAWSTGSHRTYAELAKALGIPERDVPPAIDRERKRRKGNRRSRRKNSPE